MKRVWLALLVVLIACATSTEPPRDARVSSSLVNGPSFDIALWQKVANAPRRFSSAAAYDAAHGTIVSYGGAFGTAPTILGGDTCLLDATTWTCPVLAAQDRPPQLSGAQAVYDPVHRKVVLFGGQAASGASNETFTWDGVRWTEMTASPRPAARTDALMMWHPKLGRIVLYGGLGDAGPLDDTWEWDGGAWVRIEGDKPPPRYLPGGAYDSRKNELVMFGGSNDPQGIDVLSDTWTFDGSWHAKNVTGPIARKDAAMVDDVLRNQILLFGGTLGAGDGEASDTWLWNGDTWTEVTGGAVPEQRSRMQHQIAYDPKHQNIVMFSGFLFADDTWIWDGAWKLQSITNPQRRFHGSLLWDEARDQLVLFGGEGNSFDAVDDSWGWDGSQWVQIPTYTAPPPRAWPFMAYDSERKRVVLFGGNDGAQQFGDTWTFDGTTWKKEAPANTPAKRTEGAAVWDPIRKNVVLHGGGSSTAIYGDSWTWSGSDWTPIAGTSPPPRFDASIVFDSAHGKVVLFGGIAPGSVYRDDSWTWNGVVWTEIQGTKPPPRARATLVDANGKVVLFGGEIASGTLEDTWTFDGDGWTQVEGDGPPTRSSAQAAYDVAHQEVVLFGGHTLKSGFDHFYDDTWTLGDSGWTERTPAGTTPVARAFAPTIYDPDHHRIVMATGVGPTDPVSDTWYWENDKWVATRVPAGQPVTWIAGTVYDSNRHEIVVYGGIHNGILLSAQYTDETWRLATYGDTCQSQADCAYGTCVDGVCNRESTCGPCERADGVERGICTRVVNDVDPDSCTGDSTCDSFGTCRAEISKACTTALDCATGFCVDGVCCESACAGQCEACDLPGAAGRCQPVHGRPHGARSACEGESAVLDLCAKPACNGTITDHCEGTIGPCAPFACSVQGCKASCTVDEDCDKDAFCDVAIKICRPKALAAPACDGDHTLVSLTFRQDCAPYKCDGAACRDHCESANDCSSPFECSRDGKCVPPLTNRAAAGCAIARPGSSSAALGLLCVGAVLGGLFRRRRRLAIPGAILAVAACANHPDAPRGTTTISAKQSLATGAPSRTAVWERVASPPFRRFAPMVWDGARHQIVLFGGEAGVAGLRDDTCVYDDAGGWRCIDLPATERPPPRQSAQIFYDSNRMKVVLTGGFGLAGPLSDTWLWDGARWEQSKSVTRPTPSGSGQAVFSPFSGVGAYFDGSRSWTWDGFGWAAIEGGPPRLDDANAIYDTERHLVVLFGGYDPIADTQVDITWQFDGKVWLRRDRNAIEPPARDRAAVTYDPAQKLVTMFGGFSNGTTLADTWTWTGTHWEGRGVVQPGPRYDASFNWDTKNGRGVLFGGRSSVNVAVGDTWLWDGSTWTPTTPALAPSSRFGASSAWDPDGQRVILFGGSDVSTVFGDTFAWNGTTWVDITRRIEPTPRFAALSSYDEKRNQMVVYGGQGVDFSTVYDDLWTFDGSWTNRGGGIVPPRIDGLMVRDPGHDQVLVFGGSAGLSSTLLGDTWVWNGTAWTAGSAGPAARRSAVAAYDPVHERVVLFGGSDGQIPGTDFDDTWLWDGAAWTLATPDKKPPKRQSGDLLWDDQLQRIVLHGGLGQPNFVDDTWLWDGATWTEVTATPRPEKREKGYTTYDPVRKELFLFGGSDGVTFATFHNDSWTFDGTAWTQASALAPPPPRKDGCFVFDTANGMPILFGGQGIVNILNDTWGWNGTTWAPLANVGAPVPRSAGAMVFDTKKNKSILLGGHDQGELFGDALSGTYQMTVYGSPCQSQSDCANGACVDGVCCSQPACATCEQCNGADRPGTCTPIKRGTDPDTCTGADSCDADGRCRRALGSGCVDSADCASGFCADGVCCTSACGGQCEACDSAGAKGVCQPVRGRPHGVRAGCPGAGKAIDDVCNEPACDGVVVDHCASTIGPCTPYACTVIGCTSTCATNADCDKNATCDVEAKRCRPSSTDGPLCDGAHTVVLNNVATKDCSPFACEGSGCKTKCTSAADCAYPFECDKAGACVPPLDNVAAPGCSAARGNSGNAGAWLVVCLFAVRRMINRRSRGSASV